MNFAPSVEQVEGLRWCWERMRLSYPTYQFALVPVLIPAAVDGAGTEWTEQYEVHWPYFDDSGLPGFMWVTPEGRVVLQDTCPEPGAYFP